MDHNGKPHASVSIESTASSHNVAPTGTVTFKITGLNYFRSYNVALTAQGKTATANLTAEMTSQLDSGVYRIAATYNGSRVFLPLDLGSREILCGDTGYRLAIYDNKGNETDAVVYGDGWFYKLIRYTKSGGVVTQTVIDTDGTETHGKGSGSFGASCTARLYRLGGATESAGTEAAPAITTAATTIMAGRGMPRPRRETIVWMSATAARPIRPDSP